MQERDEMKYAEMFSKWYSWGSPVGLSVFFLSTALTALILISVFNKMRTPSPSVTAAPSSESVRERSEENLNK